MNVTLPQTNMEAPPIGLCKWNQVLSKGVGASTFIWGRVTVTSWILGSGAQNAFSSPRVIHASRPQAGKERFGGSRQKGQKGLPLFDGVGSVFF